MNAGPKLGLFIAVLAVGLAACSSATTYNPGPLTNSTACGVLNADQAGGDSNDITNYLLSANPYLASSPLDVQVQGEMDVLPGLLGECRSDPTELLSAAYNKALDRSLSATPTPAP